MSNPDIEGIAAGLSPGMVKHIHRLASAGEPLSRRSGWKARPVMMLGLSEWADFHAGTERLTETGLAIRQHLLKEQNDG